MGTVTESPQLGWRRGVVVSVVRSAAHERSYRTSGPVRTGMGDRLRPSTPSLCVTSQLGQPSFSLAIPPGSLNRVPAKAEIRREMSPLPGGR